jgi:hypothetical protein
LTNLSSSVSNVHSLKFTDSRNKPQSFYENFKDTLFNHSEQIEKLKCHTNYKSFQRGAISRLTTDFGDVMGKAIFQYEFLNIKHHSQIELQFLVSDFYLKPIYRKFCYIAQVNFLTFHPPIKANLWFISYFSSATQTYSICQVYVLLIASLHDELHKNNKMNLLTSCSVLVYEESWRARCWRALVLHGVPSGDSKQNLTITMWESPKICSGHQELWEIL